MNRVIGKSIEAKTDRNCIVGNSRNLGWTNLQNCFVVAAIGSISNGTVPCNYRRFSSEGERNDAADAALIEASDFRDGSLVYSLAAQDTIHPVVCSRDRPNQRGNFGR